MSKIVTLSEERARKEFEKLLKKMQRLATKIPQINISSVSASFTAFVVGPGNAEDKLHIIIYDTSEKAARAVGSINLTRDQWEKFKHVGDTLLEGHKKFIRKPPAPA